MKSRAAHDAVYVFPGDGDAPLRDIKTAWRGLMKSAEITDFRIHDLRHDFATRLEGLELRDIGDLLGHTQAATTLRYSHLRLEAKRRSLTHLRKELPAPEVVVTPTDDGMAGLC